MSDIPVDIDLVLSQLQPQYVVEEKAQAAADLFVKSLKVPETDMLSDRILGENIHLTAIRDEGIRLGILYGKNERAAAINDMLTYSAGMLDTIFDFDRYLYDGRVLLPSVAIGENIFEQFEDNAQAEVGVSFTVIEEPALVSQTPTFRDYIYLPVGVAETAHSELAPSNPEEDEVWRESFRRGYVAGSQQADAVFSDGLYEMHQDIVGRATYLAMVELEMIEPVELSVEDNGITFVGRTMNVGETIYSISGQPNFTTSADWRVAWSVGEEFLSIRSGGFQN